MQVQREKRRKTPHKTKKLTIVVEDGFPLAYQIKFPTKRFLVSRQIKDDVETLRKTLKTFEEEATTIKQIHR